MSLGALQYLVCHRLHHKDGFVDRKEESAYGKKDKQAG